MRDNPFKIQEGSVSDRKLPGFNTDRSSGDTMLFMPNLSGWLGKNLKSRNIAFFYIFFILLFSILIGRVSYLQIIRGNQFLSRAENNRLKVITLHAPRGIVYDRFEKPLLKNTAEFIAYVDPTLIKDKKQAELLQEKLKEKFPDHASDIDNFFRNYSRRSSPELIAEHISHDLALELMILSGDFAALQISYEPRRSYLYNDGLGHLLGYVGRVTEKDLNSNVSYLMNDTLGKSGLEKQYEAELRGVDGKTIFEVDALGHEKGELSRTSPVKGSDLILAIDEDAQKKLYEILTSITTSNGKPAAAGVVIDPRNGEVISLVSVPAYDPNIFSSAPDASSYAKLTDDPDKPLFFRAISGMYPPGSVFKMVLASAALQEKQINDTFSVVSTGGLYLGNRFFPDWRAGGHGVTNIYKAISDSVNTFFYIIGGGYGNTPGMGIDTIIRYAQKLGFATATKIDVPGEESGFLPTPKWKEDKNEHWYQGDTYNVSIGQGSVLVTPLQIARYTSFFANGGTLVQPHLVKEIRSSGNVSTQQFDQKKNIGISPDVIQIIRKAMRRTVTDGTATSLQSVSVQVAGKTGTAQFNQNKQPHSWFTAFAPYSEPTVVVTVIVEEGGDKGLAVTASRQFLEWYFSDAHRLTQP